MTVLVDNRKARFDYEIQDTLEAGIELLGFEVKALKNKKASLEGAYVIVRGGEAFLMNMLVSPYQENNTPSEYEARRMRRLLLTKDEIRKISEIDEGKNLTIVPISVYTKNNLIKVSIAIVRGKKKFDKRESIKKRETDREMEREMRDR